MPITPLTGDHGSAASARNHLEVLESERAMAALYGLDADPLYMADLRQEIGQFRAAYVGLAVTEIASLRAEIDGPLRG
jgi:hypothetical protein